jgi:hypothetical protein
MVKLHLKYINFLGSFLYTRIYCISIDCVNVVCVQKNVFCQYYALNKLKSVKQNNFFGANVSCFLKVISAKETSCKTVESLGLLVWL